jgi:plasmid stability protein
MSTLTVRKLDDDTKERLRIRAAQHGRSMEAEAREILRGSLAPAQPRGVGSRIHQRLAGLGLEEIELPPRTELTRPVDFER